MSELEHELDYYFANSINPDEKQPDAPPPEIRKAPPPLCTHAVAAIGVPAKLRLRV